MSRDSDSGKIYFIVIAIIIAGALFFLPQSRLDKLQKEYDKLEEQYQDLESIHEQIQIKYDNLLESIGSLDDDISTVYWYFDNENDITFSEAKKSFSKIYKFYDSLFYNR